MLVAGCVIIWGGISEIRKYRRIIKDHVRTTGSVTRIEKSDNKYRFYVVFTDEQGVQHECKTWSKWKDSFDNQQVPVMYYRPDPDQVIVDPSWMSFAGPWLILLSGFCFVIFLS